MSWTMHSHPGKDGTKGASGDFRDRGSIAGDFLNIQRSSQYMGNIGKPLPNHYIYHTDSKVLYNYTPTNSSIYIKTIKNYIGLNYLFPKNENEINNKNLFYSFHIVILQLY